MASCAILILGINADKQFLFSIFVLRRCQACTAAQSMSINQEMGKTKDVALVLSSGGPRGFAYIGAIEELESRGYRITSVTGCSIGSLVGGVYAAGGLDAFKNWLYGLNGKKLLSLLDVSISKSYLVKGDKVIEAIKSVVPEVRIEDMSIPYTAVATDLYTGEEVVFREGPLFEAIRASISIPSLFRPVKTGRHTLIDGGVVNTMPLDLAVRNGHDILVAFDVNQVDSEKIADYIQRLDEAREEDSELRSEARDSLGGLASRKDIPLIEKVKAFGDGAQRAYRELRSIDRKTKTLEREVSQENITLDDNYYSILARTFSLMNRTIAMQSIRLYKPDVLATMTFDTYGAIPDYTKGEEIAAKGRELMSAALDEYERSLSGQASLA